MKKIYLNRSFATTSQLIDQLQRNPENEKYQIYMSHSSLSSYLKAQTRFLEVEPLVDGREYVEYILKNISMIQPDYFLPRYNVTMLSKYREEFEELGVKTMFVGDYQAYELIDHKPSVYEDLKTESIVGIPDTYVVSNYDEFMNAYEKIRSQGWSVCFKPVAGIGGEGFKMVLENIDMKDELFLATNTKISRTRVEKTLKQVDQVSPFMVSGFMEGKEYSIDCLAKNGELILAIPRMKVDKYTQKIEYNEELIEIARKITLRYGLSYIFNIQVKYHLGIPYLIEINTRTSGGVYKSNATGANILYQAIRLLDDKEPTVSMKDLRWNVRTCDHLTYDVV